MTAERDGGAAFVAGAKNAAQLNTRNIIVGLVASMVVWLLLVAAGYRAGVSRIERAVWQAQMKLTLTVWSRFGAGWRTATAGLRARATRPN